MIKSFLLLITTLWIFKTFSLPKIYQNEGNNLYSHFDYAY